MEDAGFATTPEGGTTESARVVAEEVVVAAATLDATCDFDVFCCCSEDKEEVLNALSWILGALAWAAVEADVLFSVIEEADAVTCASEEDDAVVCAIEEDDAFV